MHANTNENKDKKKPKQRSVKPIKNSIFLRDRESGMEIETRIET